MTENPGNKPYKAPGPDANEQESKRILDKVHRDSETVGTSTIARSAEQFKKHIDGKDGTGDDEDPIEVLGKRIGRSLGWFAVVLLLIYLLNTYLL